MKSDYRTLKEFLDEKVLKYNRPGFVESDPVQIPHLFSLKEDIEISGFLTATISWGNRRAIIKSAERMIRLFGGSPYEFVMHHRPADLRRFEGFVHRTFNSTDLSTFILALRRIYTDHNGLEGIFARYKSDDSLQPAIHFLKKEFFAVPHEPRTLRHMSDPMAGSAAKRINMFLRWMVRKDSAGVDFGLWESISPSVLSCPLDIHSGNVARELGLLQRKQNDSKAVTELDSRLREFDPYDPVKYEFALFGLGIFENFSKKS